MLDRLLKRLHANKAELLAVLDRPEIPLHTNGSENDIRRQVTMLIVSHEMSFVRDVSHRVVFMTDGKVQKVGPPAQIFDAPTVSRTRDFVSNIVRPARSA